MAVSVRYGGGVWRQMEEKRVALEKQVATITEQLEQRDKELKQVKAERDDAIDRVGEMEAKVDALDRSRSDVQGELDSTLAGLQSAEADIKHLQQANEQLQAIKCQLESEVDRQAEAIKEHVQGLANARQEVEEGQQELLRLRELLYDALEHKELLEAQCERETRANCVLNGANAAKTRQVRALTKETHELAQKLAQARGGSSRDRTTAKTVQEAIEAPSLDVEPSKNDTEEIVIDEHCGSIVSDNSSRFHARAAQRLRQALEAERAKSTALRATVRALEADQRELVQRFRVASAARQRAESQRNRLAAKSA